MRSRSTNAPITSASATKISQSGALAEVTARYVIGCDGARSTVRRFMGAALQDLRSHERWIVLDMILDAAARRRA
jgi:2-polyprenyl-6-methoxyphenol hydroxylase-like FAD-dependent oxidoreductase